MFSFSCWQNLIASPSDMASVQPKTNKKNLSIHPWQRETLEPLYKMGLVGCKGGGGTASKGENPKIEGRDERGKRPPHHKPQSSRLFSSLTLTPGSQDMEEMERQVWNYSGVHQLCKVLFVGPQCFAAFRDRKTTQL
jgi:hypothetical protein